MAAAIWSQRKPSGTRHVEFGSGSGKCRRFLGKQQKVSGGSRSNSWEINRNPRHIVNGVFGQTHTMNIYAG
jgi:hypothetical protein